MRPLTHRVNVNYIDCKWMIQLMTNDGFLFLVKNMTNRFACLSTYIASSMFPYSQHSVCLLVVVDIFFLYLIANSSGSFRREAFIGNAPANGILILCGRANTTDLFICVGLAVVVDWPCVLHTHMKSAKCE